MSVKIENGMKQCSSCGQWKPLAGYAVRAETKSGRKSHCKECVHKRYLAWCQEHPGESYLRSKLARERDPERARVSKRKWMMLNSEKARSSWVQWRQRNREQHLINSRIRESRRRSRKKQLPQEWTTAEAAAALEKVHGKCLVCDSEFPGSKLHWDHWIPLASNLCPGTVRSNMVPLCDRCNRSKRDRDARDWLRIKFGDAADTILVKVEEFLQV